MPSGLYRNVNVVALAFVFALAVAAAHAASSPPPYRAFAAAVQGTEQGSPVSVEDLGRGVMAALHNGSFDALVPHLPTAEDMQEVIAKMVENGDMTEEQAEQNMSAIPGIIEDLGGRFRESFAEVQEVAAYYEVNWEETEITGYRIDLLDFDTLERREVDTATLATLDSGQMMQADITVHFAAAGGEHALGLGDCIRTSRGWVIMERFFWADR
jgi:hypothetical protein